MTKPIVPKNEVRTFRVRASLIERARPRDQSQDQGQSQSQGGAASRPSEGVRSVWPHGPEGGECRCRETSDRTASLVTELAQSGRVLDIGDRLALIHVGDVLFGFRLCHDLGEGTFARVFVAEQADLADRPVVLKISGIVGGEPQTLSRLQHTNIVPIYSVHEDPIGGLRAVCMPYFGGANLSRVLGQIWSGQERPTRGVQLVEALKEVGAPEPESWGESRSPARERRAEPLTLLSFLGGLGYPKAMAWVVAQLAEGLDHAHQRGIIHRDIKPSNILLSAEGQPLLLDFNVSSDAISDPGHTQLGGTIAYAAPEHLHALVLGDGDQFEEGDRRADLYSLGLVLFEALTGQRPFADDGGEPVVPSQLEALVADRSKRAPSIRQARPDIPWSMESIVRKCLDPDPARRYQQAGHLAEDLRQFIEDRPLKHTPELSRAERIRKFFRRNPRLFTFSSVSAISLVLFLLAFWGFVAARVRLVETRNRLAEVQIRERKRAHDAGVLQSQCLVNTILGDEQYLRQGIAVCEKTLALSELAEGRSFNDHADWSLLTPAERLELAEDRRELLLLLAGARVRLASGDPRELRAALALLDKAEALHELKPSKALWLDRAGYLDQLGQHAAAEAARARADQIQPATARDYYLLAISHARTRTAAGYRRAVAELGESLRLEPRHYWSMLQRGICYMELGEHILAVRDFGICTGLWPEHPWSYFNRGFVLDQGGMKREAIDDYTAALERDPSFVAALTNRGLARLELGRYQVALSDFDAAVVRGKDSAAIHAGRAIALESLGRHGEADAEFQQTFTLVSPGPDRHRFLWTYGFAVADRLPGAARAAFDQVLHENPQHPQALYGRAMLAMRVDQLDDALGYFNRALEADPRFIQARRGRAVVLARLNDHELANRDVEWCLERDAGAGASVYTAACVAALGAKANRDPRMIDKALDLLRSALELGMTPTPHDDPDLEAIRADPRFQAILDAAALATSMD